MQRDLNARLIVLGTLGYLVGVGVLWVVITGTSLRPEVPTPAVALLVGWCFIGSGLLSWRARPDNRIGPVMVLTGFTWFASLLQNAHNSVLLTIGEIFQDVFLAGFLYLALSFPSGRLNTWL